MSLTTVQPGMLGTPQPYNFKNRLINGNMAIWQRATSGSVTSNNYFGPDRWLAGQNFTFSQSTDVPTGQPARYSLDLTVANGNYGNTQQRIESYNCNDLSGQTVTISFWAKLVSGSTPLYVSLAYANSQDNFSAQTAIGSTYTSPTLTTTWTQYSVTFTNLPSGVLNGLNLTSYTNGSACEVRHTLWQIELGVSATTFDYRPYTTELQLCQRYFQVASNNGQNGLIGFCNGSQAVFYMSYSGPVILRASPTATYAWNGGGPSNNAANLSVVTGLSFLNWYPNCNTMMFGWTLNSTPSQQACMNNMNNGYIYLNSEL